MSTEAEAAPPAPKRRGFGIFLRDVVVIIVIAALLSFVVKTFVVRSFYIPSGSMEQTLIQNDRILVDELTPNWNTYQRGDVVVFTDPGGWLAPVPTAPPGPPLAEAADWVLNAIGLSASDSNDHLIKRIIGLPGDQVVCCNELGQITVNDAPIDELGYLNLPPGNTAASSTPFDVTVPEGSLWMMGDNRNASADSRAHQELPTKGFVPEENVVGRAFLITWPFPRFGGIDFHHSVFNGVPDATP